MTRLTSHARSVSDALETRFSCRAFLEKPLAEDDIRYILQTALRAPSGGNLQPWHVWVAQGPELAGFIADIKEKMTENPGGEGSEYHIYPPELADPYNTRRRDIGERMYATIGVEREDKLGRMAQMARNFEFFGAPCAMFFALDKSMQEGQWSDMGMIIQSIMLLARERGLHSCPQEAWAIWAPSVKKFLGIPDTMTFFCGLALGYADPDAPINALETQRAPIDEMVRFVGFSS